MRVTSFLKAFAQLYSDAADQIDALRSGQSVPEAARSMPDVDDGVAGLVFIDAVLESHRRGGAWVALDCGR